MKLKDVLIQVRDALEKATNKWKVEMRCEYDGESYLESRLSEFDFAKDAMKVIDALKKERNIE